MNCNALNSKIRDTNTELDEKNTEIEEQITEMSLLKEEYDSKMDLLQKEYDSNKQKIEEAKKGLTKQSNSFKATKVELDKRKTNCNKKKANENTAKALAQKAPVTTNPKAPATGNPKVKPGSMYRGTAPAGSGAGLRNGVLTTTGVIPNLTRKKGGRRSTRRKLQKKKFKSRRR